MLLRAASRTARLIACRPPLRAMTGGSPPGRPPPTPLTRPAAASAAADPPPPAASASASAAASSLFQGDVLRAVASGVPGPAADDLADALLAYGALSASVEEDRGGGGGAAQAPETPLFGPDRSGGAVWPACRVTAVFPAAGSDLGVTTAAAATAAGLVPAPAWAVAPAAADEWTASLHGDFRAVAVNPGGGAGGGGGSGGGVPLWVVPAWCEVPAAAAADPAAITVRLTPGMAFGTGDHPTTKMCLRWLAGGVGGEGGGGGGGAGPRPPASPLPGLVGARLLDYGAGSGILAVAGLALGAASALATDTDPLAVRAAAENADLNGVASRLEARLVVGDGSATGGDAPLPEGGFGVVVANILQGPLLSLAPLLAAAAAPGGAVAVAGILAAQAPAVAGALAAGGVSVGVVAEEGGWVLLAGRKKG